MSPYRLGILVDTVAAYGHSDPWERGRHATAALEKLWLEDPSRSRQGLVQRLNPRARSHLEVVSHVGESLRDSPGAWTTIPFGNATRWDC